ncbi:hypothetical protein AGR8A_pAt20086 [Agrobacterium fabrum str. J-07]|nr:hypothetical protein AGR8A_pAt20086 [Agrobacterium fabrum str. J-07]
MRKAGVVDLLDKYMRSANFRGIRQSMNFQRVSAKTYLTEPGLAAIRNFAVVLTIHKIATPRSLRLC